MQTWSNRITDHFKTSNPDRISQNASLTQQVVGMQNQLLDVLGSVLGLSEKIYGRTEDRTMIDVLQQTINHQAARIAALETAITCLRNKNQRQKRSLEMLYEQSPPPKGKRNNDDGIFLCFLILQRFLGQSVQKKKQSLLGSLTTQMILPLLHLRRTLQLNPP